ncbi:MAG TPA: BadF/BadG/BcrA/BcrD ATPase family protein, partial [Streptosporangiaceae bacterium]|nr:BadF/BadG/BcrA/BcrD ATPase family protein [Streptosporangiaceae bacterium]
FGPSPYYELRKWLDSAGGAPIGKPAATNYERYSNPATDALFDQYAASTSSAQQHAIINQVEQVMLNAGLLAEQGWGASITVANDTFAVLRAGLVTPAGAPWGVAVTCGAGINCVGVAPDGRTTGFLALGGITGDWGGGLGLGHAALWWAIRAEDGRGPQTALREAVAAHFGRPTVRDVAIAIHQGKIDTDDLQDLTPVLFAAAAQRDQVALDLLSRLADEIVAMAGTVLRRLDLAGAAAPVVLGGGLLTARDPQLTAWITERLAAQAPLVQVSVVAVPPIAGAALVGMDRAGAGPAAERRLRAAYR